MATLTMNKNCLNCTHCEATIDVSGKEYALCGLCPDMRVNSRMHCERWSDKMMLKICGGKGVTAHVPRNAKELILM